MSTTEEAKVPTQSQPLKDADPEVYELLQREMTRQFKGLELIASENFTSRAVFDCLGSALTNKYSEGLPGARYYGGNEFIDQLEVLCQKRALAAFHLKADEWGVNVQPYSGSPANFAVYNAVLKPHERLMGLDLPSGGHLTHGFYTPKKKISATSIYFESYPYRVNSQTGLVDYDVLESTALVFRPRLIVCGSSAYPRDWDYARLRAIANKVGALLMCDMSHYSGLVATQVVANPFDHCHIVTTTTHKSLRGPRAGMIFFRRDPKDAKKEDKLDLEAAINFSVFPSIQGGPHNNAIAAIATQLREVATEEFVSYAKQIVANARALANYLLNKGYKIVTGGTDNHLLLWDVRTEGLDGHKAQIVFDEISITLNKNSIYGDVNALSPSGVRIGTPALTSRGLKESDFQRVGDFLDRGIKIAAAFNKTVNGGKCKPSEFEKALHTAKLADIAALRQEVETFAKGFYMPGFDPKTLKYQA